MMATLEPTTASVASVEAIRAQFPALRRVHDGHPVAYFDGPGGTQVPTVVGNAMTDAVGRCEILLAQEPR